MDSEKFKVGNLVEISAGAWRELIFPLAMTDFRIFIIGYVDKVFHPFRENVFLYRLVPDQTIRAIFLYEDEVKVIAPSFQELPLEDWAGIAHLLHPELKIRVQEWLRFGQAYDSRLS